MTTDVAKVYGGALYDLAAEEGLEDELLKDGSYPRCEVTDDLLACIDILVDGRFEKALKDISLQFRGSRNQRVIDMARTRETGQVAIWEKLRK